MDDDHFDTKSDGANDERDHFVSAVKGTVKTLLKPFKSSGKHKVEWDGSDVYSTSNKQRGLALVIINKKFQDHDVREGSQLDEQNLCDAFSSLGFQVRLVRDCSVEELQCVLKCVAREDHSTADCFVLAMSSHGDKYTHSGKSMRHTCRRQIQEDVVFCTDFFMTTCQLLEHFSDASCPTLKGKPRLFFLQACRGDQLDSGQDVAVTHSHGDHEGIDEVDAIWESEVIVSPAPCFKDCLIMYATPPGYYAFRRPSQGSWFVQALCSILKTCDGSRSILQVLTSVIRHVAQDYISSTPKCEETDLKKQTPCFYSMLTKDLFLKVADEKGAVLTWS